MKIALDLGLTSIPVLGGKGEVTPPEPRTVFEDSLPSQDNGNANCNFRHRVLLDQDMGPWFRVLIQPGSSNVLTADHVAVGRWAGNENNTDTTEPLIEALYGGDPGFVGVTGASPVWSDWMPSGILNGMRKGTDLIVSFNTGASGQASQGYNAASDKVIGAYKASKDGWQDQITSGYSNLGNKNFGVGKVETLGGRNFPDPPDDYIPMTYDDPIFSKNTHTPHAINIGAGKSLMRRSIEEYVGIFPASMNFSSNTDGKFLAVKSREAVRFAGTSTSLRWCWFSASGIDDDHADTLQAYSVGARNASISVRNFFIEAGTTAATANFFVADDWGGSIYLEHGIVKGGPFGLRFQSGADGADISISLKDVYFVGPFGGLGGPFSFEDYNGGSHEILLWENVRWATIVDNKLVPGELIPNPDDP